MTKVIATINLKGGVGKTTITVALGEFMSFCHSKRVLIVDLDPQTNATVMLIGEARWKELNDRNLTLAQLFRNALSENESGNGFDVRSAIQRDVSNVKDLKTLDLLPSSLDLIDLQDRLATIPQGRFFAKNPVDVLNRAIKPVLSEYDIILIDCPPNLGLITLNGLRISHGYVIPTIPDILSTYGIPQIVKHVGRFSKDIDQPIVPYGVIVSKYQSNSSLHDRMVRTMRDTPDLYPNVFETVIPQATAVAEAAEYTDNKMTIKGKYAYGNRYELFEKLSEEVIQRVLG